MTAAVGRIGLKPNKGCANALVQLSNNKLCSLLLTQQPLIRESSNRSGIAAFLDSSGAHRPSDPHSITHHNQKYRMTKLLRCGHQN